jgi:lipocalin
MWFEILSFPQSFQKGGHCTVAKYTMTDKGYFKAGFMIR